MLKIACMIGAVFLLGITGCDGEDPILDSGLRDSSVGDTDSGRRLRDAYVAPPVDAGPTDAGVDATAPRRDAGRDSGPDAGPQCTYYLDGDEDGYGDPDVSEETSCGEPPRGYVDNPDDCDDDEKPANPGVDGFGGRVTARGSWDWNCDGEIELQWPERSNCFSDLDGGVPSLGWLWEVPDCGEVGEFLTVGCVQVLRTQGCR